MTRFRKIFFWKQSLSGLFFLLLLSVFGCSERKENQTEVATKENAVDNFTNKISLEKNFYKKMVGKIDDQYAITMHLICRDSVLSGYYFYNNKGIPIEMGGAIQADRSFTLYEYDFKSEGKAKFSGQFTDNTSMKGKWIGEKSNYNFELKEDLSTTASILLTNHKKEDCSNRTKYLKSPRKEFARFTDTICSLATLDFLQVKMANKGIEAKINAQILQSLQTIETEINAVDDYFKNYNLNDEDFDFYESQCSFLVISKNERRLTLALNNYIFTGGAHGSSAIVYQNYDLQTGKKIELKDILTQNFLEDFSKPAEKKFNKEYGAEGWFFETGKFPMTDNFAITPKGLLFLFNQYELGPYSAGQQQLFFTFQELENYLISGSFLR